MTTVAQLRQEGWKVRVTHYRYSKFDNKLYRQDQFEKYARSISMAERGGRTEISLTSPSGVSATGVAECSKKDNYNKKLGVRIALNRALYQYEYFGDIHLLNDLVQKDNNNV